LHVQRGQVGHFCIGGVIGFRIEPGATAVRLQIGLLLKNAPRGARRWFRQCRV
jgi:ABC-type Co2+ transport system permease subunit